jgi:hypothetical protein
MLFYRSNQQLWLAVGEVVMARINEQSGYAIAISGIGSFASSLYRAIYFQHPNNYLELIGMSLAT